MSKSAPQSASRSRFVSLMTVVAFGVLSAALILTPVLASISLSTSTAYTQNFDGIGTSATATLPTDWKVDKQTSAVRTLGTYAAATTTTNLAGGANLSSSASNGIYNFGSGTTTTGPDRAIGFLSSGTGTASGNLYAQLVNNTGGNLSGLQISYDVEKYRNGSNVNGFRIQMFYSPDGATWTNAGSDFLTSFAADANNNGFATAPGATVSVTNKTLNVTVANGANIYLAWNYSVSATSTVTNAQALAVDNVSILGISGGGSTNPSGVGAANPSTVQAGNSTLLTVAVTPGANPTSMVLAVTTNLSSIGGSSTQQFFDDGTHGDLVAGNNVFSFQATVSAATSTGAKSLPATITDAQSRSGSASIALTVTAASTAPTGTGSASPNSLLAGNSTLLTVTVTNGTNPTSTGLSVTGDLSSIGGSGSQQFFDNGTNGDVTGGDNIFSFQATVSAGTTPGAKSLPITISDAQSRTGTTSISLTVQPPPPPTTIKISQVYGGGGNSGSTYTNDFIEIFNQGPTTIDVTNWSVQYNSAGATGTWQVTNLCPVASTCTVAPGHYYLVQESQGAGGTTPLPAPDATGVIMMSGTSAKVALVASTAALTGCPTGAALVDLVGYGPAANCFEMSPTTSNLSATTAAVRRGNGCIDTDNNANDFVTIGPIPRNSASPVNSCGGDPTQPSGLGIASPASVDPASTSLLTVNVTPATTPPSTGLAVNGDLTSIGGSATQQFYDDGTNGDNLAGDNVFSYRVTVGAFISTGVKNIVTTITDAQARTETAPITMTVQSPTCGVERWSVKTGTDPDAGNVDLNDPVHTTIVALGAIPAPVDPPGPPLNARVAPTETTVYVINATMTLYKKENDVDYHLVLQDDTGATMIAEIPCPCCVGLSSPFAAGIANARAKFDARFTATPFFQTASIPVQITGVGFFDFIHGQTGVAPNGIELHPVLDINFTANTSTTLMSSANPSQYGQSVDITATVTNGGISTPTGQASFFDGASLIGSRTLDQNGQATFSTSTLSVGSHSITASYEGDSTSHTSTSTALVQVVNRADQTINFGPLAGKTYGDADFMVSATASSGLPVSFSILSGPATISGNTVHITGAGTVMVQASQGGDGNYNAAPDAEQSFIVAQATASIPVNGYSGVYDGNAHRASGSATGVNAEDLSSLLNLGGTFTNVPGGTAHWTFSGNANYASASGDAMITITARPITVTADAGQTKVYGTAEAATFTYSITSGSLVSGDDFSGVLGRDGGENVGSYAINQNTLTAGSNYTLTYVGASFSITERPITVTADASQTKVYGSADPASFTYSISNGSLVSGDDFSGVLARDAGENVGSYAINQNTLTAGSNYTLTYVGSNFEITQAAANITVNDYSGVYDGSAHGATGSATGVNGENLTSLNLGATFTNVPGGTAHWTFAGNTNYVSASGDANITITKATPVTTWNNPADIVYGTLLSSTQLNATANVSGPFNYTPAAGTLLNAGAAQPLMASFTPNDTTNYNATSKNVQINVLKATPSFSNLSSPVIIYGTASTNLSGKISFGSLIPTGSIVITLNSVTQNAAIQAGGNFSSTFATGSLVPTDPPYSIAYSYGGDSNFNSASGSGTLTVGYGIVALYDQTKVHQSGSTIPIKLEITGATGNNLSSASTVVTAVGIALVSTSVYGPVEDAGNANPDSNFRFTVDSYIFNLQTTGLSTGVYDLYFRVGADPTLHTVQFQIK